MPPTAKGRAPAAGQFCQRPKMSHRIMSTQNNRPIDIEFLSFCCTTTVTHV